MPRFLRIALGILMLAGVVQPMQAQQAAFLSNARAIRFEHSPGFFHFVVPCKSVIEYSDQFQAAQVVPGVSTEPAICWPVSGLKMTKVDGKMEASPLVQGSLVVAEHNIRFMPQPGDQQKLYADFRPGTLQFQHEAGKGFAFFGTLDSFYKFSFLGLCSGCKPGTAVPAPANAERLDEEFALVKDAFTNPRKVEEQIQSLSAMTLVVVRPENQPTTMDKPSAMGLYAAVNQDLAPLCPADARTCVEKYAAYESCQSATTPSGCGDRPTCSAECELSAEKLGTLKARPCVQADQESATLLPDWALTSQETSPAGGAKRAFPAGVVDWQFNLTSASPPSVGCGVEAGYQRAKLVGNGVFGVAGMDAIPPIKIPKGNNATAVPSRKVMISNGVAQSMLQAKVDPVYPVLAKAARVSGTVVLQGVITTTGDVSQLTVVSGPAMLQDAALTAVRQWKYKPFLMNGTAVEVQTQINVIFQLGTSDAAGAAPKP